MRLTRAELTARIARAERRRATLAAERDEFDRRARYSGGEDDAGRSERAAARAQYMLFADEVNAVDAAILADRQALDALVDRLAANVLKASRAQGSALDALLEAECDARDAGEAELADSIDRARKALVHVGLGTLHDSIMFKG